MRHVPRLSWIIEKLDVDLRRRLGILTDALMSLPPADPHRAGIETAFLAAVHAIDRLAETAKHERGNHAPTEIANRLRWSINHAVTSLNAVDPHLFGRRFPMQTHERSRGEQTYAALLMVIDRTERALKLVRTIDPNIDEKLLKGLVVLHHPVDEQTLKPIA